VKIATLFLWSLAALRKEKEKTTTTKKRV